VSIKGWNRRCGFSIGQAKGQQKDKVVEAKSCDFNLEMPNIELSCRPEYRISLRFTRLQQQLQLTLGRSTPTTCYIYTDGFDATACRQSFDSDAGVAPNGALFVQLAICSCRRHFLGLTIKMILS
jgi:hypothetical protein